MCNQHNKREVDETPVIQLGPGGSYRRTIPEDAKPLGDEPPVRDPVENSPGEFIRTVAKQERRCVLAIRKIESSMAQEHIKWHKEFGSVAYGILDGFSSSADWLYSARLPADDLRSRRRMVLYCLQTYADLLESMIKSCTIVDLPDEL